ncbi:protein Aster-B-like isoform X4 [Bolinopsis microptera]|uniref:protein Aster-B-like isoform X4 n=1 Tax=Bolinopsis microptera TaxID=2820187 RepID=UPI00307A6EA4
MVDDVPDGRSPTSPTAYRVENGGNHLSPVLAPHNLTPNSVPSSELYPDSTHSSFDGVSVASSTHNTLPNYTYHQPSPLLTRDEVTGDSDKKKRNKKIKRAMKHLQKVVRPSPHLTAHNTSDFEKVESESSISGVSFMSSIVTHMLPNTNPKSREHDFHKLFKSLPEGETLIQDFSCALLRDILVQGRLYVSQNWFCFYANILGWETLLTIEVSRITSIKKEKTALVINNAISISTNEEKYFFSSFMSRDSAYNHMCGIWRRPVSRELAAEVDGLELEESEHAEDNSDSYISEDDDASSDIQQVNSFPHPALGIVLSRPSPPNTLAVPSDHGPRATEAISFNEEDDTCACVSHYDNEHLNQEFDLSIEKLYKSLFNDESVVQSKMRTLLKAEDYEATSWHDSEEGASERTLTYRVPLNANLGPKWAEVIEKQVLTTTSVAAKCYVINCEVTNPNVPYGDKFNIVKRYCLTRGRDNTCKLRLTSDVQYKKGVWGMVKSIIEKNSKEGIKEYCEDLCMCLQEESAGPGIKIRKSAVSGGAHTSAASTRLPRARSHAALPDNQSRATTAVSFVTDNYIAFVLLMMAVLMVLNLVLVYRLSSITSSCNNQFDILSSLPQSEEGKSEWIRILSQQQDLHKKEIQRWQDVLRWISKLVSEVHGSLEKLQKSSIYMGSSGYHDTTGSNWDTSDKTDL